MKKILILLIFIQVVVFAQNEEVRERALASRAARLDAMRQLAEAIKGIRISSKTTVKDFVTESDEIKADLEAFLRGVQQVGAVKYNEDGTVEVTLKVSLDQIISGLQNIWYNNNSRTISSPNQFDKIRSYSGNKKVYTATGSGAMKIEPTNNWQGNAWDRVSGRGKLMALRAARIDAYRNLAESIKGVRITSKTTVKDFVAESDEIRADFNGIVRGAQFVGRPNYRPNGVVEVIAQIDVTSLIRGLRNTCRNNYQGKQWNQKSFNNIRYYNKNRVIRATGSGVPPAKYMRKRPYIPYKPKNTYKPKDPIVEPPVVEPPVKPIQKPVYDPFAPAWAKRTVKVTGMGARPEYISDPNKAKVRAIRAARMDGYRQLAENIMGLKINSKTTVRDFITESDQIRSQLNTFIKGAKSDDMRILDDGTVEMDMSLFLGDMWKIIVKSQKYMKFHKKNDNSNNNDNDNSNNNNNYNDNSNDNYEDGWD